MTKDLPSLKQGDRGPAVALLQRLLVLYGYPNLVGAVDGVFGSRTQSAVLQFQRDQNLIKKDGVVGDETWQQLTYPAGTQRP
ncbi:MAG: peptidoglycan-binding protein [Synechococcales cyanobacterium M58_A2018_015]|nr:peptidoglycan-binding protein [Synechococcales cyanobacterium M58_A2018_015]